MKTTYKLLVVVVFSIVVTSCKKVIDLQLADTSPQLVIEGNLTDQGGVQSVTISQSVPFGDTNTFPPVSGATVKIIESGGSTRTLTERAKGTYSTNSYFGRYDLAYTLQVQVNGQTYTAKSIMPTRVDLDSLGVTTQTFGGSSSKTIAAYFQDPIYVKNQYRVVMYVNTVEVKVVFVRSDQFSDGRYTQALLYQNDVKIKAGDRIDVELQCIDPEIYTYWYTFSQQQGNGSNNSATPTNPPNNFDNNVLGYFSAHTAQRKTIIVR